MPIYEYICLQCKNEFEIRVPFSQVNFTPLCPKCQAEGQRLMSSFACKTGGNIQAAETPFRQTTISELGSSKAADAAKPQIPNVLITPPPNRIDLLSAPRKRSVRPRRKSK